MNTALTLRVEWLDAPDVSTPELAATWARYEIWSENDCLTQVEASDSTFRRGVYGSLFPLAEWVVENWWQLTTSIRPSAVPPVYWTWPNARSQPWLFHHNVRAAGNGMAWPNLTVVSEGAMTCIRWAADTGSTIGAVRFASSGTRSVPSGDIAAGLTDIVNLVLQRLDEAGVHKTRLAADWAALGSLDDDEKEFCATAARLGLDPFAVPEQLADEIIEAANVLPADLKIEFFDNAHTNALPQAARWTSRAFTTAGRTARRAQNDLRSMRAAIASGSLEPQLNRPWELGYAMARRVRELLASPTVMPFDVTPWVALGSASGPSAGIKGVAAVAADRCGLVPDESVQNTSLTFATARALGRTLAQPDRKSFLLSAARSSDEQTARAFAAELLAPAAGILELLSSDDRHDDEAFDSIARRFRVSPFVIKRQYDNQVAHLS